MQGRPELASLPRFRSASRRTINRKTLQMQGRRPKSLPKFRPAVRQNGTSGDSWLKRKAAPPSHLRIVRLLGPLPGGPARLQNLKTRGRPTFTSSARPPATGERTTLGRSTRHIFTLSLRRPPLPLGSLLHPLPHKGVFKPPPGPCAIDLNMEATRRGAA